MNRYLALLDRRLEQRGELIYLQLTVDQSAVQCAIPAIVRALTVEQLIGGITINQQNFFLIISPTHINLQQWPRIPADERQGSGPRCAKGGAAGRSGIRCRRVHPDRAYGAGLSRCRRHRLAPAAAARWSRLANAARAALRPPTGAGQRRRAAAMTPTGAGSGHSTSPSTRGVR